MCGVNSLIGQLPELWNGTNENSMDANFLKDRLSHIQAAAADRKVQRASKRKKAASKRKGKSQTAAAAEVLCLSVFT